MTTRWKNGKKTWEDIEVKSGRVHTAQGKVKDEKEIQEKDQETVRRLGVEFGGMKRIYI